MPIYGYKCDEGHTFEVMQSMSDDALDRCEVCGAPAQRVLFAPAVHFKGSGFYTTDYARKGSAKPANGGEAKTGDGESGSGGKSGSDGSGPAKAEGAKPEVKSAGGGEG